MTISLLFFTSDPSCLSSSLLSSSFVIIYFIAPDEDIFLPKVLVFYCFLVFRRIHDYISLETVPSVLSISPVVVHSFLRGGGGGGGNLSFS